MKTWIYISGIIGGLLIIIGLSGIFKGLFLYTLILIAGLGMTCLVCFPLYWSEMKRQKKKRNPVLRPTGMIIMTQDASMVKRRRPKAGV